MGYLIPQNDLMLDAPDWRVDLDMGDDEEEADDPGVDDELGDY